MATGNEWSGRRFIPLALGLGVMVVASQASEHAAPAKAEAGPIRCEIQVKHEGGGVQLEGVVFASDAIAGSYRMQVRKTSAGGSSNVSQGGDFSAGPDAPARVGLVTLGGDDGAYSAKLKVTWTGGSVECEETIGRTKSHDL
jgi:hypothetical protein